MDAVYRLRGLDVPCGDRVVLGFRLRGAVLHLDPYIPRAWRRFEIAFRYHGSRYEITVENHRGVSRGLVQIEVDGRSLASGSASLPLTADGATHRVRHPGVRTPSREFRHPAGSAGSVSGGSVGGPVYAEALSARSVVVRSEIRPRDASGVGARAALLLLLLQGGTHACGLLPASWGALFRGHRSLLSVARPLLLHRRPLGTLAQLDRNARGRPAVRACPVLAPAVTGPRARAPPWAHGEHRLGFHLLKPER